MKKYVAINISNMAELKAPHLGKGSFFSSFSNTLNEAVDYEIENNHKINLKLRSTNRQSYPSLTEAQNQTGDYQIFIEFDDKTKQILAIHDPYFAVTEENKPFRVDLSNLILQTKKYSTANIEPKRFFDSLAYALLLKLSNSNKALPQYFKRGLILSDYLYQNPPRESYRIVKREVDPKQLALKWLKEKSPLTHLKQRENKKTSNNEKSLEELMQMLATPPAIPQINIDDFNVEDMLDILKNYGSFELVGPSIERFKQVAGESLEWTKKMLSMELKDLEAAGYEDFNGFQDFRDKKDKKGFVRNQIGFHYKPYISSKHLPKGVTELKEYDAYYEQGMAILKTLYRKIAITLKMDPKRISPYETDTLSALSVRKYFDDGTGDTGIPEHSDSGLLTLVLTDAKGLEILKGDEWITAPHSPGLRFYVNIGDWVLLQLAESMRTTYRMGIHRVPQAPKGHLKHSVLLCLNPHNEEVAKVNGEDTKYATYVRTRYEVKPK